MTKQKIAIDIDEVLLMFTGAFITHHNDTYGTYYEFPDPERRYYLEDITGESSEIIERKLRIFVQSNAFQSLQPLPDAFEAIVSLKKMGYELSIITARQSFFIEATHDFVNQHFPEIFSEIHFVEHALGSSRKPAQAKLEICKNIGVQYIIDDNLSTIIACAESDINGVLFGNYVWNEANKLPERVTRCANWAAVESYFAK